MSKIREISITVGRKHSANYCVREISLTVNLEVAENENPTALLETWTRTLETQVDLELGDTDSKSSFTRNRPGELLKRGGDDPFADE